MSDLFTAERLAGDVHNEIVLLRNWLDRIERDVDDKRSCIQAGLLLDIGQSYAKLSYSAGMLNKARLMENEVEPVVKAS